MNKSDLSRNLYMLKGPLAKKGYDWWWHSFTGYNKRTGESKAFFIEYFIINPGLGGSKPILGQLKENKESGRKPSYVMIKAGAWGKDAKQINSFYPISDLKISKEKLEISVGQCFLTETEMKGEVKVSEAEVENHPEYMSDAGTMKWNFKIDKKIAFHVGYGASKFFRAINAFEMFWHAEGMKTEYSGEIIYDGIAYEVIPEKSYGYADKNWGENFTSPWVWISSCNMKSKVSGKLLQNSVIDIGGGRPKVFGISLNRKLLTNFFYEGCDYEFNFSKFWTITRTKFKCYETKNEIIWEVITQNRNALIDVKCSCKKDEMIKVNYESPDGRKRHNCLWNGGTGTGNITLYNKNKGKLQIIDDIEINNIGCEYGEYTE